MTIVSTQLGFLCLRYLERGQHIDFVLIGVDLQLLMPARSPSRKCQDYVYVK